MILEVNPEEAAYLLNVLSDNARPWNRKLRETLQPAVSATDAYNARRRLLGLPDEVEAGKAQAPEGPA